MKKPLKASSPLISVATVVYNDREGLRKTMRSVFEQSYPRIEFVVVDGGSTDGTAELIEENAERIGRWVSEPDEGIYDAMNKAAALAEGDYIQFLNAGDTLFDPYVIEHFAARMEVNPGCTFFGRALVYSADVSWTYPSVGAEEIPKWLESHDPNHQALFFPKSFYKSNRYDTKYKITADLDYKLRAKETTPYRFVDRMTVRFALGGISTQNGNLKAVARRIAESFRRNVSHGMWRNLFTDPPKILFKYLLAKISGEKNHRIIKKLKQYR